MFTDIDLALNYVMGRMNISEGLNNFRVLMDYLDNPEDELKFIHVGGTNGKGSYIAYMMNTLMNEGYNVGTFQSPHLVTHLDRIRINDNNIDSDSFLKYLNQNLSYIQEKNLNMFEIDFLIMCQYFRDNNVDIVLLEVGLGGRLDVTNVIKKSLLTVITSIGYDHQEFLGNTLELIANEKAGIIKNNCPTLIGVMDRSVTQVFENVCKLKNSDFYIVDSIKTNKGFFTYKNEDYPIGSLAKYQMRNASLVVESVNLLNKYHNYSISKDNLKKAIKETVWKGRFQVINKEPLVILDGAHNEDGIKALVESFDVLPKPIIVICSFMKDKNYLAMLEILIKNSDKVYLTSFDYSRALKIDNVSEIVVEKFEQYTKALERAYSTVNKGTIVICGSLYFVSEIYNNKMFDLVK